MLQPEGAGRAVKQHHQQRGEQAVLSVALGRASEWLQLSAVTAAAAAAAAAADSAAALDAVAVVLVAEGREVPSERQR